MQDLIIKNGKVYDSNKQTLEVKDIALCGGRIADAKEAGKDPGIKILDARDYIVAPGLLDMHCHIYPLTGQGRDTLPTIDGEAHLFKNGVTTAVDAGTCGCRDFFDFKERFIDKARLRILAFVNIASGGMVSLSGEQEPDCFYPETVAAIAREVPQVVGIKTAHYRVGIPFDREHPAWASVDSAIQAGLICSKPVMADFQPNLPERTYEELVLKRLRKGDIHTHVYAGQFPILDKEKKVNSFLYEARERGVVFDLGHGAGSFLFRNAIPAYRQGFYPDTISTDLYFDNINGPVFGLLHVMSKYLNMGMSLEEVLYRTTKRPAEVIGRPELGDLEIGRDGDVTLLNLRNGRFGFADSGNTSMKGDKLLECVLTVRKGELVYNPYAFLTPLWERPE